MECPDANFFLLMLSSVLGMDMKIAYSKTGKILTSRLSRHIGTRGSDLVKCKQGVLGTGTVSSYEFLHLDFGFWNWFGVCVKV